MNILVVAYFFPPCGGGGVQRILKLVKYLRKFGHEVTVVTTTEEKYSIIDESMMKEVPSGTRIVRMPDRAFFVRILAGVRKYPKSRLARVPLKVWNRCVRYLRVRTLVPDLQISWAMNTASVLSKRFRNEKFDIVLSTSSPYSSHILGERLATKLDLPFVVDFRDPWVRNHYAPPHRAVFEKNFTMESRIVNDATKVVVVSEPMIELLEKDHPEIVGQNKIHCLTNGFDESDFADYMPHQTDTFEVLFAGSIYGVISIDNLSSALIDANGKMNLPTNSIRFRVVGMKNEAAEKAMERARASGIECDSIGYLPHEKIIREYETASLLVLILPKLSKENLYYSGKIFEYIRTYKPVLAIAGEGVASALLKKTRSGTVVDPEDIDGISACIQREYYGWKSGDTIRPDRDVIQAFSRESMARRYEALLYDAIGERRHGFSGGKS